MIQSLLFGTLTDENNLFMILFLGYSILFAIFDNKILMTVWRYRL